MYHDTDKNILETFLYYWSIDFYNAKGHARKIEGFAGEPKERAAHIRKLLELVEREISINLGSIHMYNS